MTLNGCKVAAVMGLNSGVKTRVKILCQIVGKTKVKMGFKKKGIENGRQNRTQNRRQ